jgi:HK97 family phage portal protein
MALFDKFIESYLRRKGLSPQQGLQSIPINTGAVLTSFDAQRYTDAYSNNSDVYAIVSFLARKAAAIPWYVYRKNGGNKAALALERYKQLTKGIGHPGALERAMIERKAAYDESMIAENSRVADILKRPNSYQGMDQFMEQLFGYRFLSGEGFVWGNDGETDGEFVELYILPAQYMALLPDPNDLYGILGWEMEAGTGRLRLQKEDVMQWKSWTPNFDAVTRDHLRGVSPIKAAWQTYLMGLEAQRAAASQMANGGAKGALVPRPVNNIIPNLTEQQASKMQMALADRINNNSKSGQVAMLQASFDYLNFGLSNREMALIETMQFSLQQWCRVFGMPVVLFSPDNMADNNYQNALRDLVTNTIVPMCAQLRDELNKWLVPRMGDTGVFVDFDISALPELQRDLEKMVAGLVNASWLTMDEKRIAMNYEPKGGAYDMSYVSQGLIPLEQAGMDLGAGDDLDTRI